MKSPCVDVCVMDEASGYCRGCKRTLEEIAGWARASDAERSAVLAQLVLRTVSPAEEGPAQRESEPTADRPGPARPGT